MKVNAFGVWAFGESLMRHPFNLCRKVSGRLIGDSPAIFAFVVAASKRQKSLLVKRLPTNLTASANVGYAAKRERIPPAPTDAAEPIRTIAVKANVREQAERQRPKEEIQC
jgi:hypothetical protein